MRLPTSPRGVRRGKSSSRCCEQKVNNAGIARLSPVSEAPVKDSLSQIALNITALTRLTHVVLPAFKKRNEGDIINISSVLVVHALPVRSRLKIMCPLRDRLLFRFIARKRPVAR